MTPRDAAERWLAAEPDADMRSEIATLLEGPEDDLTARFTGRLQFGTAGLRAAVGAGPQRMNRLVVRQAAAGLADYLLANLPDAATRGVIIGYDARRKSDSFAADTARVCAARGVRALLFDRVVPTPCLAWNITGFGAAAGVMVTASHNPPADNGYKVYLDTGSQILPPYDSLIAACIDKIDACTVELAAHDHELIEQLGAGHWSAYVRSTPSVRLQRDRSDVTVAYTAMHGVGGESLVAAFEQAGFAAPVVVTEQQQPDATFPTVSFPNPEEPGAMDLLIAQAKAAGADIAVANDPDADRLGAAIPQPDGSWRRLGGDEIGWLLADHILQRTSGDDRLVVTTVVSSSMLSKMAAAYGVQVRETFTGFKWIGHVAATHPDLRFVFGYEQALGYAVSSRPLDKDGITAALLIAEIAAVAKAEGVSLQQRLDELAVRFGRHVMAELSVRMDPAAGTAAVAALRAEPPTVVADRTVTATQWFDEAGLLRLQLGETIRLQVRPSGTEPKVKLYAEGIDTDPSAYLQPLADLLA
jgi:phosphomannomutase